VNRAIAVILAGCVITVGGCGTMTDVMCGPVPLRYYAGVQNDAAIVKAGGDYIYWGPSKFVEPRDAGHAIAFIALGLADMPFSAVADTFVLPLAFAAHRAWADPPVHVWGSQLGTGTESEPDAK
jgi:uncharacterized protein YceK